MWSAFAASATGVGGNLVSLTFLVVAFRFDVIATSDEYRNRAAQVLTVFVATTLGGALTLVATTLGGALTLVPQPPQLLGGELLVIAVIGGVLHFVFDAAARQSHSARPILVIMTGLLLFSISVAGGGGALLAGLPSGLSFFALSFAIALVVGVLSAWWFLTRSAAPAETASVDS